VDLDARYDRHPHRPLRCTAAARVGRVPVPCGRRRIEVRRGPEEAWLAMGDVAAAIDIAACPLRARDGLERVAAPAGAVDALISSR